jgi:hypothetical protein
MTKEKVINGVKFTAAPFTAVEGLKLKAYLARTFGPALGEAIGALKDLFKGGSASLNDIGGVGIDGPAAARAVERLITQLDEGSILTFFRRLLSNVQAQINGKDGQPMVIGFVGDAFDVSMELAFSGNLFSVYPVILMVLEVNYPDFFGMVRGGIGAKIRQTLTLTPENASGPSA